MPISDETREKLVRSHRFGADMVDIASRAHFKCEYCSADMLGSVDAYEWNWEREHITPTSAGGEDDLENWAMACRVCNQLKGRGTRGSTAEIPPGREELVAAARAHVQALRAERQIELSTVRALVAAEVDL